MLSAHRTKGVYMGLRMRLGLNSLFYGLFSCALVMVIILQQQLVTHRDTQIDNLRREARSTSSPVIQERIVTKEITVRMKPQLHPNWADLVLSASSSTSFTRFEVSKARFWYAVEDTLHSAKYILNQEMEEVKWWIAAILETQKQRVSCNVLDVGSNGGFFSLLSRSLDCNVLAVDAQPWCLTRLSSAAALNGFYDKISTRWSAVSDNSSLTITVGATKCSGLWAVKNSEWINRESSTSVEVTSSTCAAIVNDWLPDRREVIQLMKIDAEGSEIGIIRSALPLLQTHRIQNIIAEFVPGRTKEITPFPIVQDTLSQLYSAGYGCFSSVRGGKVVTLEEIQFYFDPMNTETGRNTPHMWRCSLLLPH
jgi:FkbM family methyltransferase